MSTIQIIRSKIYDWRRARYQMLEFRPYTAKVPFSYVQDKLRLSSAKWNFSQESWQSTTGHYVPARRAFGRIYHKEDVSIRRNYTVLPEAFVGFSSSTATPHEFLQYIPLNTDFRIFIVEAPNGGGASGFPTFQEMLPHTRAGLYGKIDACGVLQVTGIILNGRTAEPYNLWRPQRAIVRVINVLAELIEQIETGAPYEPAKAQQLAWRASTRLPQPQPPFFRPISKVRAVPTPSPE